MNLQFNPSSFSDHLTDHEHRNLSKPASQLSSLLLPPRQQPTREHVQDEQINSRVHSFPRDLFHSTVIEYHALSHSVSSPHPLPSKYPFRETMDGKGPPAENNPRGSGRYQLRPSLSTSKSFSTPSSAPSDFSPFSGSNDASTDATPITNLSSTPTSNIPSTPSVPAPPANTQVVSTPGSGPLPHPLAPVSSTEVIMLNTPGPLSSSSVPPSSAEEPAVKTPGSGPLSGPFVLGSTTEAAMTDTPELIPTPPAPLTTTEEPIIDTPGSGALSDPFATFSIGGAPPMATPDTPAVLPDPTPFIEDPFLHNQETGPMFMNLSPSPGGIVVGHGPTLPGSAAFPVSGLPQPSETPFFDEACKSIRHGFGFDPLTPLRAGSVPRRTASKPRYRL